MCRKYRGAQGGLSRRFSKAVSYYGLLWMSLGWGELRRKRGAEASYSTLWRYSVAGTVHVGESGRGPAARATRGTGNAGCGASPTTGKRECFSFLSLA
jgi:hypothetical protein